MTPTELKNETFESLRGQMTDRRRLAYDVWLRFGPGTNEEVAAKAQWPIRSLQPRTSELYEIGLIAMIGRRDRNGVYQVRSIEEWERWKQEQLEAVGETA